jgi:hypothetical protein
MKGGLRGKDDQVVSLRREGEDDGLRFATVILEWLTSL